MRYLLPGINTCTTYIGWHENLFLLTKLNNFFTEIKSHEEEFWEIKIQVAELFTYARVIGKYLLLCTAKAMRNWFYVSGPLASCNWCACATNTHFYIVDACLKFVLRIFKILKDQWAMHFPFVYVCKLGGKNGCVRRTRNIDSITHVLKDVG
jgi:hypothetical protein